MFRFALVLSLAISLHLIPNAAAQSPHAPSTAPDLLVDDPVAAAAAQGKLLSDIRQLTFEGKRAGEGYFSKDGRQLVFQSEREPDNPFFQIYLMDRETGDVRRISPGIGKTTCAWIHPEGNKVLFASTQYDPEATQKQARELEVRASGKASRYSWDYDATYDMVEFDVKTQEYRQLTTEEGYDAEGSYSPDGEWICFASNRRAYADDLTAQEQELFEVDPASAMDIYMMRSDGTDVKRLTTEVGYDGGPFFSPTGDKVCWRRFTIDGAVAEIMVMNTDGSDQRAITQLGAMSWAPFFHPSGDYLIFATNLHGFSNFELYLVDAQGQREPQRVTYRAGFDSLPTFTPDGQALVWTSNGGSSQSQLFEATWNDAAARELLKLDESLDSNTTLELAEAAEAAEATRAASVPGFSAADVGRHVDYLCRPELGGRLTGTEGERRATAYVAAYLESLGLQPAGQDGTFFHEFQFVSDVALGTDNALQLGASEFKVDKDWRPVFFSKEGSVEPTEIVCAGYGIVAPAEEKQDEYDSYVHLDVKDKWVLVFRQMPQDVTPERRQHLARYSGARYKAMVARERGARGLIFVSGPKSQLRTELMPLELDGSMGAGSLSVISVNNDLAAQMLTAAGQNLNDLQTALDSGEPQMGFLLADVKLAARIDIEPVTSRGRNVLALLPAAAEPTEQMIVIGAHIDHLGTGSGGNSLAKAEETGGVHRGADDNASGVACMLEVAQYLSDEISAGRLEMKRDVLIAAWSGEELGLRGSQAFADDFTKLFPERAAAAAHALALDHHAAVEGDPHSDPHSDPHAGLNLADSAAAVPAAQRPNHLYPQIAGCLNLDMVGRLRENLVLQGIGSSPYWAGAIERRNLVVRLPLVLQKDCNLPTDASTFFLRGVPILSAFTGSHSEYHTPRDVPELLNYEGAAKISRLMALITRDLVTAEKAPEYQEQEAQPEMRANLTAYMGTVPDYVQTDIKGVKLGGVTKGAPADKAGVQGGDIIVELAGKTIENIYDYTYAIEALKVGQQTTVKVQRGSEVIELEITPTSRQ